VASRPMKAVKSMTVTEHPWAKQENRNLTAA